MEYLNDFKWSQRTPDDKVFILDEHVLDNSVSFKILKGKFHDPLLETSSDDNTSLLEIPKNNSKFNFEKKSTNFKQLSVYIPGLCKLPIYPQKSKLSTDQHRICIKVLQSQHHYCVTMPKVTINDKELQIFNNLIPIINEERQLFMEHAKNIWNTVTCGRHLKIKDEHKLLIEHIQKKHKTAYKKYPQFYKMATMLPLVYNSDIPIELKHLEDLRECNELPLVNLPTLKRCYTLPSHSVHMESHHITTENKVDVVSVDNLCEDFAIKHKANIVISSNGLKVLANNQPPFSQFWDLPIYIKNYNLKDSQNKPLHHTVVYIDRSIPICNLSNKDKNFKCYKHLLKTALVNSENICSRNSNSENYRTCSENKSNDKGVSSKIMNFENASESSDELVIDETKKPDYDDKDQNTPQTKIKNKFSNIEDKSNKKTASSKPFMTYKLWKIGQVKGKNLLCKNLEDDIKFIVRCKVDGYEVNAQGDKQILSIVPKIEYQNEFGSEMNTPTETAYQWTLLQFRPESKIIKARIIANKSEIMMIEKLSMTSIMNETAKLGSWKPESALGCYFNIFSKLKNLQPGNYILRHDPKNHAFAILYHAVQSRCENVLDLEENYRCIDKFLINQTAPWTPIDPSIVTPNLAHKNLMPCMFTPGKCQILKKMVSKRAIDPKNKIMKKKSMNTTKK